MRVKRKASFIRTTKNNHLYEEEDTGSQVLRTIYVQKSLLGNEAPPKIIVTIEVPEEVS